ncbi:sugar-binding domain-containing protein [Clostridium grantii]|uniref:Uncharacterized protein n=1 Tax=Clostridium grantii DSM 8605 TaxID=1121316 RepID=A0A1M5WAW0_9CLOT|nr:sugar-binding domain-containing protein [Clostridium grantii]SHH84591.1 protein of unknown function [Clostridium grantii DSM 8605]
MQGKQYDFNKNWKFYLGDLEDGASNELDDLNWRPLNVPHDWSVEFSFDENKGEGCTGYLLGGIGWYRKSFIMSEETKENITYICFDGIYNNAEIYVNGEMVGDHPYGYAPIYYDISKYLKSPGEKNIISVKVDHSHYADSRWYTGSGIYRKVDLVVVDKLHIPIWGTFITADEINEESARVNMKVTVENRYNEDKDFSISTKIISPSGKEIINSCQSQNIKANEEQYIEQSFKVDNPKLWDINSPLMYTAVTAIRSHGNLIQEYKTPFGIRSIEFDSNKGFYLNGRRVPIKGVCLHHDGGLVGAAVPAGVWRRRLKKLKEAGCNAIRSAHNPCSEEFLNLCDEMGFLLQVEFYDEWDNPKDKRLNMEEKGKDYITSGHAEHFQQWAEKDLKATMLRDRNHPCVFQWSIGNEIEWTYPKNKEATGYFGAEANGNYFWELPPYNREKIRDNYYKLPKEKYEIGDTARKLADWTREMDTTRPVIANCILPSASYESGYADVLDVVGYSYRQVVYDYGHKYYPEKPIMSTESVGQWQEWKQVIEREFVAGMFIWTGIDYMGEANNQWPNKGLSCGMIDFAGFDKHSFHMMKTLWQDEPHVYLTSQNIEESIYEIDESKEVVDKDKDGWKKRLWAWHNMNRHWNYDNEKQIVVEVYSNCPMVELLLNGKSMGKKYLKDFEDRIYKWVVPFNKGTITARGSMNGEIVIDEIVTSGKPAGILLTIDKKQLIADGTDVVHVVAQLVDKDDIPVYNKEKEIKFNVKGECRVLGVDNGASSNVQDYQATTITTNKGRCLLILQSTEVKGNIEVTAESCDFKSETFKISVVE